MDAEVSLADRVLAVLTFECGRWMCDRCVTDKLGSVNSLELPRAVAQLYAERAVRLMRGVCCSCRETDHVVSIGEAV